MVCTTVAIAAGCGAEGCTSLSSIPVGTAAQLAGQSAHRVEGVTVLGDARGRALAGVQDGRVVAAPEGAPDRGQRLVGELAREVHGELARPVEAGGTDVGEHVVELDLEVLADAPLDFLDRARPRAQVGIEAAE